MRNVRPSWVNVNVDGRTVKGTGPRSRTGELSLNILSRINGSAVPFLTVDAIGSADGLSTFWRVTDNRTGKVLFEEKVAQ